MRSALIFSLFLFASACAHAPPKTATMPQPPAQTNPLQHCDDSSDCIRVDNGCCDCANGGETISINRKYEVQFRSSFDCTMVICSQKVADCLFREPVCKNGRCELGPQRQLFPKYVH